MKQFDLIKAEQAVRDLLQAFGQDLTDENLIDTPKRVAKYWKELLEGEKKLLKCMIRSLAYQRLTTW